MNALDGELYLSQVKLLAGWALKMLDASAKEIPSGALQGAITDLPGNMDSCLGVQSRQITTQYCIVNFQIAKKYNSEVKDQLEVETMMQAKNKTLKKRG